MDMMDMGDLSKMPKTIWVKSFGQCSMAGNVGRTGSAKTNQDSVFVSKMGLESRSGLRDALKIGP